MKKKESSKFFKGVDYSNALKIYKTILISIIIIGIVSLFPLKALLASNFQTGEILKRWKIKDGEEFTIEYIHSVEKSPVTEKYRIKDDKIILTETTFKSFGAGLPATSTNKFQLIEDGFRIYDIDKEFQEVIYRTGAEIANHKLQIAEKTYEFLDFSKGRTAVRLSIEKTNFLKFIINKI